MKRMIKKSVKRFLVLIILVCVGLPAIILAAKKLFSFSSGQVHAFFTPEECNITFKDFYSNTLTKAIRKYIAQQTTKQSLLNLDPAELITDLKEAFPIIKSASYRFIPPKTVTFDLEGTKPLCIVNSHFVLGDQRNLVALDNFDESSIALLPEITINPTLANKKIRPRLYRFLHKLTPYLWKNFNINYHQPWQIELIPKKSICPAKIIASEKSIFNTDQFASLAHIFKDLCCKKVITQKALTAKNYPLIFDTRIKKYIIVRCNYPAKRGGWHG